MYGGSDLDTWPGHGAFCLNLMSTLREAIMRKDLVDLLSSVKPVLTRILPSPVLVIEWTNLDLNGSVSSF